MKEKTSKEIELGEGVTAQLTGNILKVMGPKGEVERKFDHPRMEIKVEGGKVILIVDKFTKRERKIVGSFQAHIKNMVKGVKEHFVYKVQICSGHFPMSVSVSNQELTIKNFLGESVPRKVILLPGGDVKINGNEIVISSPNKEVAGQNAAKIESLSRISNRDKRIFQDGCYIVEKAGKKI